MALLKGKKALVTGGSRGIGRSISQTFADNGAQVVFTYYKKRDIAIETLSKLNGEGHQCLELDLRNDDQTEKAVIDAITIMDGLDILVNNAGIFIDHPIDKMSFQEWKNSWQSTLDTNLIGPANVCFYSAKHFIKENNEWKLFTNGMKPRRSKTGMFPMGTIVKMLQNENYIGIDIYRDLKGECPPIVDKKLFYSVQDKFLSMRKIKEVKNKFLLRGILRCSDGLPTTCLGVNKTRKHPLYSCNHRKRKQQRRRTTFEDCNFIKSIRMESLDFHIWDTLCNTLFNSVHIKEKIRQELVGNKSSYTITACIPLSRKYSPIVAAE